MRVCVCVCVCVWWVGGWVRVRVRDGKLYPSLGAARWIDENENENKNKNEDGDGDGDEDASNPFLGVRPLLCPGQL